VNAEKLGKVLGETVGPKAIEISIRSKVIDFRWDGRIGAVG
jgi:hypothetical protein